MQFRRAITRLCRRDTVRGTPYCEIPFKSPFGRLEMRLYPGAHLTLMVDSIY